MTEIEITKKPWYLSFIPKSAWHWILDTVLNLIDPLAKKTATTIDDEGLKIVRKLGHEAIDAYL